MTTKISGDNISAIANQGVNWNAVTVADGSTQLNASAGNGYILDTNTGVIEVFLPSSPTRGDTVILVDYAGTFATNNVIVNTGGTLLDSTSTVEYKLITNDTIAEFVYIDSTKGWITKINTTSGTTPSGVFTDGLYDQDAGFITATGGTVTESGDFKIHSFTGDGCFVVSSLGSGSTPCAEATTVDYLVVAGGGSGGARIGNANAGGGAGGMRFSASTYCAGGPAGPRAASCGLTITATTYPITVGAGGGGISPASPAPGNKGSDSIFSTITSTGGGFGGHGLNPAPGGPGGSGGGGGGGAPAPGSPAGTGNTPPTSPSQGSPGGVGGNTSPDQAAGGGGGMMAAGIQGVSSPAQQGVGGAGGGIPDAFGSIGVCVGGVKYFSAGGGAGNSPDYSAGGAGGTGSGGGGHGSGAPCAVGNVAPTCTAKSGIANTGGGGGGAGAGGGHPFDSGSGGKGIIVLRYRFQNTE